MNNDLDKILSKFSNSELEQIKYLLQNNNLDKAIEQIDEILEARKHSINTKIDEKIWEEAHFFNKEEIKILTDNNIHNMEDLKHTPTKEIKGITASYMKEDIDFAREFYYIKNNSTNKKGGKHNGK